MKKSFQHITPLETMNFCTTLVNILEGMLKPENLNAKADQVAFESYFVLMMVWAFGGALRLRMASTTERTSTSGGSEHGRR